MADVTRFVEVIFAAVDETTDNVNKIGTSITGLGNQVETVSAPFTNLAENILKFEGGLLTAEAAVSALVLTLAGKFDTQFQEILTLFDAGKNDVDAFRDKILTFGGSASSSFDDVTRAVYNTISSGVAYGSALDIVDLANKGAVAGLSDVDTVSKVLVQSFNALGTGTGDAGRVLDILFETVRIGVTTFPELSESIGRVTPVANTAGISFEEVGAALAILTQRGLDADEATTALRGILTSLLDPTKEASTTAASLGIEFDAAALKTKGLTGVIEEIAVKTGGSAEQMAELFGNVRAFNGVAILASDGGRGLADAVTLMENSAGAAERAYQKMADTIGVATQQLINAAQEAAIRFGQPLIASFVDVEQAATEIFQAISAAIKSGIFDPIITAAREGLDELAEFLTEVAQALPDALNNIDFSPIIDSFDNLVTAILGISDLDLTNPQDLTKFIQGLINLAAGLNDFTATIITNFTPAIKTIIDAAFAVGDSASKWKEWAGTLSTLALAMPAVITAIELLGGALTLLSGAVIISALPALAALAPILIDLTAAAGVLGAGFILNKTVLSSSVPVINEAAEAQEKHSGALEKGADSLGRHVERTVLGIDATRRLSEATGIGTSQIDELAKATGLTEGALLTYIEANAAAGVGTKVLADGTIELTGIIEEHEKKIKTIPPRYEEAANSLLVLTGSQDLVDKGFREFGGTITNVTGLYDDFNKKATTSQRDFQTETEKAVQKTREFELEWEKVRSAENVQIFKVLADIKVAEIQAQAQQVQAAFESINVTVGSTGQLISDLVKAFVDVEDNSKSGAILELIKLEEERRTKALELQEKLVTAQTAYLEAVTARLNDGQALITVDGEGLEPELEAFMFRILERVQIRASEEGQQFLLGIKAGL